MAYVIITTAIEQYGFFWKLTLSNCVSINCRFIGVSVNERGQNTVLRFVISTGLLFYINIEDILYISKGSQF